MKNKIQSAVLMIFLIFGGCKSQTNKAISYEKDSRTENTVKNSSETTITDMVGKVIKPIRLTDEEWKKKLTEMEYYVLREEGTERAFTGDLLTNKEQGVYVCAACGFPLFDSQTKFKSGTGWPSFYQPIYPTHIKEKTDYKLGYARTEVECRRCGSHLGHIFHDGPKPTGLRYCINSVSLDFIKEKDNEP